MLCTNRISSMAIPLTILSTILTLLVTTQVVLSDDNAVIPPNIGQLEGWFQANVKPLNQRKGIDPALMAAEAAPQIITVSQTGNAKFRKIQDAINSVKSGNTKRVIIHIGGGVYKEKIKIDRTKPFITLHGSPNAIPTLVFGGTAREYGTVYSGTVTVESDYFMASNIIFKNCAPRPTIKTLGGQALALRIMGNKAAFYNCRFYGFQDTLCDDEGRHFYKDCFIEGTVDFIFGRGKSLYLNTKINVLGDEQMTVIAAQSRETATEDTGYSFVHCQITGTGTGTYLGRSWMPSPKVVFSYTSMSSVIQPVGWFNNFHPEREWTSYFAEYKCFGPGANQSKRVKFEKHISDAEVRPMLTLGYIGGSSWLLPPPKI